RERRIGERHGPVEAPGVVTGEQSLVEGELREHRVTAPAVHVDVEEVPGEAPPRRPLVRYAQDHDDRREGEQGERDPQQRSGGERAHEASLSRTPRTARPPAPTAIRCRWPGRCRTALRAAPPWSTGPA